MMYGILRVFAATILMAGIGFGQPKGPPPNGGGNAPTSPGPSFKVEGDVKDAAGTGIFGAIVTTASNLSATTNGQGHFILKGLHRSGTYVVRVSKPQYTFQPDHNMVSSPPAGDVANVGFTGTKTTAKK
jgi:hypothetical protein